MKSCVENGILNDFAILPLLADVTVSCSSIPYIFISLKQPLTGHQ